MSESREWRVYDETHILNADALARITLRQAADEDVRRPLWEFPPNERRAVLHERARRWGAPNGEDDFDPEYR
jgi:hypothetical protein